MSTCHKPENIGLIQRFTGKEKVVLRVLLYGMMMAGTIGIVIQSTTWGLVYMALSVMVMAAIVLPVLCARCPYPFLYADCLFMPPHWVKRWLKYQPSRMDAFEVALLTVSLAGLVLMPQFWLIRHWEWLGLFWLFALPLLVVFPVYYCRRCRHARCPFNCVKTQPSGPRASKGG